MFDSLLGAGGKFSKKCKHCVKATKSRVELIRRKKHATARILKKDVADLLADGHDSVAFGRIDELIVEMNHASCYDMIEQYCQCILNQIPRLQKQSSECPEEAAEAVATLIFAASRCSDLPELYDLRRVFTERYGSTMESSVNSEFAEKMQKKTFSTDRKLQVMQDMAREFSVNWDMKAFKHKRSSPPAPPSAVPVVNSKNGGRRFTDGMNARSSVYNMRKEATGITAIEVTQQNQAAHNNSKKEAMLKKIHTVDFKMEAKIDSVTAVNSGDRAVSYAGGSIHGKKEVILNSDNTSDVRKETVRNSVFSVNKRSDAVQDVSFNERCEPPPRSYIQRQQVQPEPKDIHVIPIINIPRSHSPGEKVRNVPTAAKEIENMEPGHKTPVKSRWTQIKHNDDCFKPKVTQNGLHNNDQLNEGVARSRPPTAQDLGLIGSEKQSVAHAISRDVKAVNMLPIYKGVTNGSDAVEKVLDPTHKDEHPPFPLRSRDARPMSMIPPPYTKPRFRSPSNNVDDAKLANESVKDHTRVEHERSDDGEKLKPISVRSRLSKPPVENGNSGSNVKPLSESPNADVISDHVKPTEKEMAFAVKHNQHVHGTSHGRRKHRSRSGNTTIDGDRDGEEAVVDRLLLHLSKKSATNEARKPQPRVRPPIAEVTEDASRAEQIHRISVQLPVETSFTSSRTNSRRC